MNSIILQLAAKYLKYVFIIFSVYILLSGHNAPGGGFIGGLLAGSGVLFYALAYGANKAHTILYFKPKSLLVVGFLLVLISAGAGLLRGKTLLTGLWTEMDLGIMQIKLGTPLLFDTGIYLIIIGAMLITTLSIMEELEWK